MLNFGPGSPIRLALALIVMFVTVAGVGLLTGLLHPLMGGPVAVATALCILVYLLQRWRSHLAPGVTNLASSFQAQLAHQDNRFTALASLAPLLDGSYLPFGSMALEPQALNELAAVMQFRRCKQVLECGSGLSTLVLGELLRQQGEGHLWSLEEDRDWHDIMQAILIRRGLDAYVSLIYAPRQATTINGLTLDWYASGAVESVEQEAGPIDLLLVDGPTSTTTFARYPALPTFAPLLKPDALVVLDDANREHEQMVLGRWQEEFALSVNLHRPGNRGQAYITFAAQMGEESAEP